MPKWETLWHRPFVSLVEWRFRCEARIIKMAEKATSNRNENTLTSIRSSTLKCNISNLSDFFQRFCCSTFSQSVHYYYYYYYLWFSVVSTIACCCWRSGRQAILATLCRDSTFLLFSTFLLVSWVFEKKNDSEHFVSQGISCVFATVMSYGAKVIQRCCTIKIVYPCLLILIT